MTTIPKLVLDLVYAHSAWIVGSAANPDNKEPRDYDIIVPFSEWNKACMLIPMDAKVNHFGGWKCISEGKEVDIWPGDISYLMISDKLKYAWHYITNTRWKKI